MNIKIQEARLRLCHVNLEPAVTVAISDNLKLKPAQYPYSSSKTHTYCIARGSTNSVLSDLLCGECPDKLFVFMVDSRDAAGNFNWNPYAFNHFNLSEIGFMLTTSPYRVHLSNLTLEKLHQNPIILKLGKG